MLVGGVDYSLSSPCVCVFSGTTWDFNLCKFYFLTSKKSFNDVFFKNIHGEMHKAWVHEVKRYNNISDWAIHLLWGCDFVLMEDYAYAAKGRTFALAENMGMLKHKLWCNDVPFDMVAPAKVKKYATGKGNAGKDKMYESFLEETGVDIFTEFFPKKEDDRSKIPGPVSDIVDAYYICQMAFKAKIGNEEVIKKK